MQEIEYELREEDLIHFNEARFKDSKEIQKSIRHSRLIMPGLLGLVGLFYMSYYGDMATGLYIIVLAVIWSFTSPMVVKWSLRQQVLTKYTSKEKADLFGHYKLVIEPRQLVEKSPGGKYKMLWQDVLRVEYGDKYVYLFTDIDSALIIPVETVSKGNLEEFAEEAENMIEKLG